MGNGIFQFVQQPGKNNVVADPLSRYPTGPEVAEPVDDPSLKGLEDDLYVLERDEGRRLLQEEFEGDRLEDIMRFLRELMREMEDRVKRRVQSYWYNDGCH